MQATPIVTACEAGVNSKQADGVSPSTPVAHPHDSSSSQPSASRTTRAYAPIAQLAARDELDAISAVLVGQWEHLRPYQAAQLMERALDECKHLVPAELHSTLNTIVDFALMIRRRGDRSPLPNGKGPVA